jgi:glycosyltransferase involved in cell wall biosynthesis
MRLAYLYNEILPTRKAHDAYVWRNCTSLAEAGLEVVLACGRGSAPDAALALHYGTTLPASLHVARLAIVRRNFGLPFTWNRVFDVAAQRLLARERPDAVLLGVRKQGGFHLARKLPGMRYVYEVHELAWYPTLGAPASHAAAIGAERHMLSRADLVTVTTRALHDILRAPPYGLRNAIEIVPLAISPPPAPPRIAATRPLHLMYIGQLYSGQGVEDLIAAVAGVDGIRLTIVGGSEKDVARMRALVPIAAAGRIAFTGFVSPAQLPALAAGAHAFAAPFRGERRMPFVAHTKLAEYVALRRPVVAPDLPIVREHFPGGNGWASYPANDVAGLAGALRRLLDTSQWNALMEGIARAPVHDWARRATDYRAILRGVAPA